MYEDEKAVQWVLLSWEDVSMKKGAKHAMNGLEERIFIYSSCSLRLCGSLFAK